MTIARDIMSNPVITVTPTTPITEIARVLLDNRISGCPVVDVTGTLRGIISRANLLDYALGVEGGALTPILRFLVPGGITMDMDELYDEEAEMAAESPDAQEIMTQDVVWVTPEAPLGVVARCMSQERIHRVPVMEAGKVVGIITSLDLLSEFAERDKSVADT